jgi:ribosomal-protein-alanine N-acetyltransferase
MTAYAVTMQVLDEVHLLNITVHAGTAASRGPVARRCWPICVALARNARGEAHAARSAAGQRSGTGVCTGGTAFVEIGRRRDYYPAPGGREDAIVMAREL